MKNHKHTKEARIRMSKKRKGKPSWKKGKTLEEIYGNEKKANEVRNKQRISTLKALIKNPDLIKSRANFGKDNGMYGKGYKLKGEKNGMFGKKQSENTKQKIREKAKNRKHSDNTRKKLSKIHKKRYQNPIERMKSSQPQEKNGMWKGGISFEPYSNDWTDKKRKSIKERDEYICQLCKKYGNAVHHIDYNKKNCRNDNLITLCGKCNSKVNANRNYWTNYFQELLRKIYVYKVER